MSTGDETLGFMHRALALAAQALYITSPNPRVGCLLVKDGQVIGAGHTQQAGGAHAEIMALRDAQTRGQTTQGASAYLTLEPCAHQGRTGPCWSALAEAGIKHVVASLEDPNPLVAGQGFARLRAAGVQVSVGPGALESRQLNIGFFSRMLRKRPWVRMKIAATLDGRTALPNGQSQWLTSPQARADGHAWRARACATLTGIGTVLADNPRLDVRDVATPRQPRFVLVDSRFEVPQSAACFIAGRGHLIYTKTQNTTKELALARQNVQVICQALHGDPSLHKVDLAAMLHDLAMREVNELHLEAGHKLNASFLRENLVDELLLYYAPRLMGQGAGMAELGPLSELANMPTLHLQNCQQVGPDLRVTAIFDGHDQF